jgi:hypothetical protein
MALSRELELALRVMPPMLQNSTNLECVAYEIL